MMYICQIGMSKMLSGLLVLCVCVGICVNAKETQDDDTPSQLAKLILSQLEDHLATASSSVRGRTYGGCSDSFSVFGFLAFLLALLDLVLELQADDGMGRKKRDTQDCQDSGEVEAATSASYSMLRGFLNALGAEEPECAHRFLCEAAEEAAMQGPLGEVIASVASLNAGSWLGRVNSTLYINVSLAGEAGIQHRDCAMRYSQCWSLPQAYRYPGVYRGTHLPDHLYKPVLTQVMDALTQALLT